MTLEEAIKTNKEHSKKHRLDPYPDYLNALELGIEAIDLTLRLRAKGWSRPTDPLPGETEE